MNNQTTPKLKSWRKIAALIVTSIPLVYSQLHSQYSFKNCGKPNCKSLLIRTFYAQSSVIDVCLSIDLPVCYQLSSQQQNFQLPFLLFCIDKQLIPNFCIKRRHCVKYYNLSEDSSFSQTDETFQ